MKCCPECGTRYDDYVENCLADGQALEPLVEDPEPVVVASTSPGGQTPMALLLLSSILFLLLVIGGGVVYLIASPGDPPLPVPDPVVAVPTPPSAEPVEVPVPVIIPTFAMVTTPPGADVLENGMVVCETPCTVPHVDEASLPRTFTFRLDRYREGKLVVDEVGGGPYLIELKSKTVSRPARPAPTDTVPSPTPSRPAPRLGRER